MSKLAPKAAAVFLCLFASLVAGHRPAEAAATDKITQVEVVNTPAVTLTPGASVTVAGSVRSQGTAPAQPVQARVEFNGGGGTSQNLFLVPAGQRLVIEHVSGYFLTDGGIFVARIADTAGTIEVLPATAQGPAGATGEGVYVFNQTARIDVVAGGSGRQLSFELYAPTSGFSGEVVLTGFLVPN